MFYRLLISQYQRIERYDNWIRRHFTMTGHFILILMLAAAIFGVDTRASTTYQLFVFLAVITAIALLASIYNSLKVSIARNLPKFITVGEPFTYRIEILNLTQKKYFNLGIIDLLGTQHTIPIASSAKPKHKFISFRHWRRSKTFQQGANIAEVHLPTLEQHKVSIDVSFTPLRRGLLTFTGCLIANPDVLGLFRRMIYIKQTQTCIALPKRYPVNLSNLAQGRRFQPGGICMANSVGDSAEFISLREYQYGDPKHAIHWKSLAKYGKLIIKQYQDEYFARQALLLDTFAEHRDTQKFEAAVSVAASIAFIERNNDTILDLLFAGKQVYHFSSGRGIDSLPHIQEVLASVQLAPSIAFTHFSQIVLEHCQICSSLICIFLEWDEQRKNLFKQLTETGIQVIALVIFDSEDKQADLPPSATEFLYLIDSRHVADSLAKL